MTKVHSEPENTIETEDYEQLLEMGVIDEMPTEVSLQSNAELEDIS
ncbi:hypothetical protein LMH73_018350 [Vibrio splendidus]|nr:hypothetical protein [Vibrio splendidus]MCC4880726.1 hypothetical protein [Vibrio splendidus]